MKLWQTNETGDSFRLPQEVHNLAVVVLYTSVFNEVIFKSWKYYSPGPGEKKEKNFLGAELNLRETMPNHLTYSLSQLNIFPQGGLKGLRTAEMNSNIELIG